jgi:hypothetical protein
MTTGSPITPLQTRRDDVLRFLTDPRVPFTNKLAEQVTRMMKLRQKISGGCRSEQGANEVAVNRLLIATAKKAGLECARCPHSLSRHAERGLNGYSRFVYACHIPIIGCLLPIKVRV